MKKVKSPDDLAKLRKRILGKREPDKPCITVCYGTGCHAYGCEEVGSKFKDEVKKKNLGDKVDIRTTGCHGFCERGPIVVIHPEGIFYQRVKLEDIEEIISETIINEKIIDRLLYVEPNTDKKIVKEKDIPFYKLQQRIIFGNNGLIDPTSIDDYIAIGGYTALAKVLSSMEPEKIIEEIKKSGLRGRGGGGFPTGRKWESCRNAKSRDGIKYVICNADEGDPGAYMDRSLLEGNPHSVIEGMLIGAYAIGSNDGYVYVRNEYPLAVKNLEVAIRQAEEYRLLGKNILGSKFNFHIKINRGAGAFVCGEETALISSIEGKHPEPKQRPPFPAVSGLWRKPTNINNVETWATIPPIILKGAEWFSSIGTEKSKGTKIFSLVGKINNTGLVEVPMGISLKEIIHSIGGGIPNGKKFKAVQTGGPSGGCIPEELLDLTIDYEKLTEAGSMMGSGGMIVMDEDTCMVDIARYFLNFLKDESCGKCVPCREGIKRMQEILTDICEGKGKKGDIELLEELSETVKKASLCALGGTAPNPVLTTIRYFRDEYQAHIEEKRCPAGVCKELIRYSIAQEKCTGCGACQKVCPQGAILGEKKEPRTIDEGKCIKCGACLEACKKFEAVVVN